MQVTTGSVPVSMASVIIHIPQYTKEKNPLMYLTGVHTDQVRTTTLLTKVCTFCMEIPHKVKVTASDILWMEN